MISGFEIRLARLDDEAALRRFIDSHWRAGHALARSSQLLNWQYRNESEQRYNVVVAARAGGGDIDGMLGYIPLSHFDPALRDRRDIWLALWKVRNDIKATGLGLAMLMNLKNIVDPHSIGVLGLTDDALRIYRALRYRCGTLDHFYLVNPNCERFTILGRFDRRYSDPDAPVDKSKRLRPLDESQLSELWARLQNGAGGDSSSCTATRPIKSAEYFVRRYAEHPFYRYDLWAVEGADGPQAILATRQVNVGDSAAIRLVDFHGFDQGWRGLATALLEVLQKRRAEYIDLYARGDVTPGIETAGFLRRDPSSSVIVPNYFEPFEQRNVDLDFAYWSDDGLPYRFFKGDTDQDRPNLQS